jgi:CO/xanthine dehydrogenase Mo-binding subunit
VAWTAGTGLPDQATVFDSWRKRSVAKEEVTQNVGDATAAMSGSALRIKATYDFAVQTHATIGPSCAVADSQGGKLTVWTSSQATHSMQHELAVITGLPRGAIRLVFIEGGMLRAQRHRRCRCGRRADRDDHRPAGACAMDAGG